MNANKNIKKIEINNLNSCHLHPGFYYIPNNKNLIINKDGVCISLFTNNILKTPISTIGYRHVKVWTGYKVETYYQHRLLALTFIDRPERHSDKPFEELEVNHIDSDKANNKLTNLEWVTPKENIEHARLFGYSENGILVLSKNVVTGEITKHISISECARLFDIWSTILSKHLYSSSFGRIAKNWNVFKLDNKEPWPELDFEEIVKDSWDCVVYWEATNLITNEIFLTDKLCQLSKLIEISESVIKRHRSFRCPHLKLNEWIINKKLRNKNEVIEGLANYVEKRFPPPVDIHVHNLLTDEITIFSSLTQAANYAKIKLGTISYHLVRKNSCTIKNFTFQKIFI